MTVDWHLVAQVGVPVVTLFLGAWVTRWFEKRPALTSYFGHVSAFKYALDDGKKMDIYTHSVVLSNAGRKSANNVRLRHAVLPSFQIVPPVDHKVIDLADGAKEILIPTMVPSEQLTISYLYFPPLTYANVNAGIKSDEGFATQIPVLLQRQYPKWLSILSIVLVLVGVGTILYAAVTAVRHLLA
jgi:hypothetical protein